MISRTGRGWYPKDWIARAEEIENGARPVSTMSMRELDPSNRRIVSIISKTAIGLPEPIGKACEPDHSRSQSAIIKSSKSSVCNTLLNKKSGLATDKEAPVCNAARHLVSQFSGENGPIIPGKRRLTEAIFGVSPESEISRRALHWHNRA